MCSHEPNQDKWNYRLERALIRFIEEFSEILDLENTIVISLLSQDKKAGINLDIKEKFLQIQNRNYSHSLDEHIVEGTITDIIKDKSEKACELKKKYEEIQTLFIGLSKKFNPWNEFINYHVRSSKEKPFFLQKKIDINSLPCGEDLLIAITDYQDTLSNIEGFQQVMHKGATIG
jgi:hypothetical protein